MTDIADQLHEDSRKINTVDRLSRHLGTGIPAEAASAYLQRRLRKEGLVTLKELYIDGTKIEANANRYTFVWRGSINYHLAGLLDTIDSLYQKYNAFLNENGYGSKYDIGNAQMFIIEGMDKVRNNIVIEIDNCSPIEILKLQKNLVRISEGENIAFVYEKEKENRSSSSFMESWKTVGNV